MGYIVLMTLAAAPGETGGDPITALLARDWAALGGWSLFLLLAMLIVLGSFRELWVPGSRYKRLEAESARKDEIIANQQETIKAQSGQLDKSLEGNQVVAYFLQQLGIPKRQQHQSVEEG